MLLQQKVLRISERNYRESLNGGSQNWGLKGHVRPEWPGLRHRIASLGGHFGPEKKYLAPPPPRFPDSLQTPSRPLGPPPSLEAQ